MKEVKKEPSIQETSVDTIDYKGIKYKIKTPIDFQLTSCNAKQSDNTYNAVLVLLELFEKAGFIERVIDNGE